MTNININNNEIFYFDMDGVLANFHEVKDGWKYAKNYNFIRNLRPFADAVATVNALIDAGVEVYISSLCASEDAKQAKIDWLAQYIPALTLDRIIILVGSGKKHEHLVTADGILVDDKASNVKGWRKAGHKAIFVEEKGIIDFSKIE